ncbi:hypothetical protein C8D70_10613 [Chryseobacterium sp. CBTAP 102]|nr:hypothetical protein C8D70_10613 [Chryseobacterium sp. CBTAP 102]
MYRIKLLNFSALKSFCHECNVENKKDEAEADFIFWLVVMAH